MSNTNTGVVTTGGKTLSLQGDSRDNLGVVPLELDASEPVLENDIHE